MTVVHRNKSKKSADSKHNEDVAAVASLPPISSSITLENSFSALQSQSSDSDSDSKINLEQFEWNTLSGTSETELAASDEIRDSEDVDADNVEESQDERHDEFQEESTDASNESYTSSSSEESVEEEIVNNDNRYRRVRQPWCRDGVPCAVSSIVALLAFAYFMQFVFYMCGLVNDDCCSPASLLQCSKRR